MSKPKLPNIQPALAAGIDPKTGRPFRAEPDSQLQTSLLRLIKQMDEQDAVTRYKWINLPCNITSQELERLLYLKGQLCFFMFNDKFYFMPYALDGTIDFYGRYNTVHPVPMTSGSEGYDKDAVKAQENLLSQLKLDVVHNLFDVLDIEDISNKCVLLHDYTKELSQTTIPRYLKNEDLLKTMSEILPMARTALRNSTGVTGMRVNSEDERANVIEANKAVDNAVLQGQRYIPIIGNIDFQDLADNMTVKAEEFLMAYEGFDNFRLSTYGLDNGGLYNKKQYVNKVQVQQNGYSSSPLEDGLSIRKSFCDIVNALYGFGIDCEIAEIGMGGDSDFDGQIGNEDNQEFEAQEDIL